MVTKLIQSGTKTITLLLLSFTVFLSACDNDNKSLTENDPLPTEETEIVVTDVASTEASTDQSPVTEEQLDTLTGENKKLQDRIKQLKAELEKKSIKGETN